MMKKLICVICFAMFSVLANAGIFRNAAKPAAKASAQAVQFSASKTYKATKATAKASAKAVARSAKLAKAIVY